MIPSGIIFLISVGANSKISSGDLFPISPRDLFKITEDNIYATLNKYTSYAHTNYKIHLVNTGPTTTPNTNSYSTYMESHIQRQTRA